MEKDKILSILQCKCPSCSKGKMFRSRGNPLLFKIPKMSESCDKCEHKFEIEPGFFFGAMYVSYALAVAQMVACFVIFKGFLDVSNLTLLLIVGGVAFLTSTFNYRVSRAIWIYTFYKKK